MRNSKNSEKTTISLIRQKTKRKFSDFIEGFNKPQLGDRLDLLLAQETLDQTQQSDSKLKENLFTALKLFEKSTHSLLNHFKARINDILTPNETFQDENPNGLFENSQNNESFLSF